MHSRIFTVREGSSFSRLSRGFLCFALVLALGAAPLYAEQPSALPADTNQKQLVHSVRVEIKGGPNRQVEGKVRNHTLRTDVHKEWGGEGSAPNPVETFAFAVGACVVNTGRLIAMQEKLDLKQISVVVSGVIDMHKVLGMETSIRAGFQGLTMEVTLEGGLSAESKARLLDQIRKRCPVCDNAENATPFNLVLKD